MTNAYQRTIRMINRLPLNIESGPQPGGGGGVGARRRVRTPDCYRDGAVYMVVRALDAANAIGDPDDLARIAETVVDVLSARRPGYEGWLLARDGKHRVVQIEHAGDGAGVRVYTVATESDEEDDDG